MKAILLLLINPNLSSGALKRYIALYNYIITKRDDYCLIINKEIYDLCRPINILNTDKNIFIINLKGNNESRRKDPLYEQPVLHKPIIKSGKGFIRIRNIIGKSRYFLRLLRLWIKFSIQFIRIIKKNKISHVYSVWTGGMWAWPVTKILKIRLFYSANEYTYTHISKNIFSFFDTEYWVFKKADKIDFLSKLMVQLLEGKIGTIDPLKISVSPNSFINYSQFYPEYPKNNSVVFMARLYWDKNPLVFLKAIKSFNSLYPDADKVSFYILGEGPMEEEIRSFAVENNLTNVIITGSVAKPYEILKRSKIFISIQIGNNYPSQSLLEAMACGNAIIATDVGETRLLVTENEGILINLNDQELALALVSLFNRPHLIEKSGKNAREAVLKNHTVEKFAQYFFQLNEN